MDMLTPEQQKIQKLQYAIKKFKEYDEERKKHYASLEMEVGMLKSEIDELKDEIEELKAENGRLMHDTNAELARKVETLTKKNQMQRTQLKAMQRKIELSSPEYTDMDIDDETYSKMRLKLENNRLQEKLKRTKRLFDDLLCRMHTSTPERFAQFIEELCNPEHEDK